MILSKFFSKIYCTAPLTVVTSAIFAVFELAMMWMVIPQATHAIDTQQDSVVQSLLGDDGVIAPTSDISSVISDSACVTARLNSDPRSWQKPLVIENPCSRGMMTEVAIVSNTKPSQAQLTHQRLVELADRATYEFELTSIMNGKISLANISGSIYQEGDTIFSLGGECSFVITKVTGDSVSMELLVEEKLTVEFGSIKRVLFLARSSSSSMTEVGGGL